MEEKKKKTNKRTKTKYPGLNKNLYSKIKQEFFDIDYVDKLSDTDKKWLNDFMNGDLGANTKENPVFEDYEEKRKCWKKNNDRNNDVYSIMRATGKLFLENSPLEEHETTDTMLDDLNADALFKELNLLPEETITIEEVFKRVFFNKRKVYEMLTTLIKNKRLMFVFFIEGEWKENLPKRLKPNTPIALKLG